MGIFDFLRAEKRSFSLQAGGSLENPANDLFDPQFWDGSDWLSDAGENVSIDKAMGVPAIWQAVNFISNTIASLPLDVYRRNEDGSRERVTNRTSDLLHSVANDEMTSHRWRQYTMQRTLLEGRGVTYIERNGNKQPVNLWPLDPKNVRVERRAGKTVYVYTDSDNGSAKTIVYSSDEILDVPFTLKADQLRAISPIMSNRNTIGLMIGIEKYASSLFANGGVPQLQLVGPMNSPEAIARASADLSKAVRRAQSMRSKVMAMPDGHKLESIGIDPEKTQLVELKRFMIVEVARIYGLPPVFLQDLTYGTFSNTEQQDLQFVKHALGRWVNDLEQEMNLKIFGRGKRDYFCEFNVDGLLRGDFKTRMDGYAQAIATAQLTPNETRRMENRADLPGGADLYIQGAMVPLVDAGKTDAITEESPNAPTDHPE